MKEHTILELQSLMKSGTLSSRKIVESYLERIKMIDVDGPRLNSIIEVNPDALKIADELDKERKTCGARGPMHGIPVVLKDNLDTSDKMMTTAGSLALLGSIPSLDAFVVGQLRKAGAVILAKANLSEWANFRSEHSSSGWSSRGGQTRNPYALDRNPCGSSSGSAVAVAANLCSVAVGTETDGSVICPSTTNGIVGIKPTVGLVSRSGIIPISHTQDTAGPMGRTVTDAATLLSAMTGIDPRDSITKESEKKLQTDYTQFLDADGLKGARIGVIRNLFGFDERVDEIILQNVEVMKKKGAEIIDPVDIPSAKELWDPEYQVLLYEFKETLNAYLAGLGLDAPVKSLEEIIKFNKSNQEKTMPIFGQDIMIKAQEKGGLDSEEYIEALEKCRKLSRDDGLDAALNDNKLDALIAPSGGPTWLTDHVVGDHSSGGSSSLAAVSGYSSITVPAGYIHGLPVGISFISGPYQEPTLIRLAYSFEQATSVRVPPQFKPSVAIDGIL
ncbi:MAG: amidase [Candidatus Thorarchaeota archaeon]